MVLTVRPMSGEMSKNRSNESEISQQVQSTDSLVKIITLLVKFSIPEINDDDMLRILRKRCKQNTLVADLLASQTEMQEMMDKDDQKELKKTAGEAAAEQEERKTYAKEVQEFAARVRRAKAKAKGKAKPKAKPKAAPARKAVRMCDIDDSVTEEFVNSLLPPGHKAWRDAFCCRWQWSVGRQYGSSKSWKKFGYAEAARMIVKDAWTWEVGVAREVLFSRVAQSCVVHMLFGAGVS